MANSAKNKLESYSFLLQILQKNCGKKCTEKFKKIISLLNEDAIEFLSACTKNIITKKIIDTLPKGRRKILIKTLIPHKKIVQKVINKSIPLKKRKKLIQNGGAWFLPLVTAVLPLISTLLSRK